MKIERLKYIKLKKVSKPEILKSFGIGLVVTVFAFAICELLGVLGLAMNKIFYSSLLVVMTFFGSSFCYINHVTIRNHKEQQANYVARLNRFNKETLIKYSNSKELTESERNLVISVLNERYEGWSL